AAGRVEHPAVAMVGEFVEAEIGLYDQLLPHFGVHYAGGHVEDPVLIGRPGPDRVLALRNAEQHHSSDPGIRRLGDSALETVEAVLHHPRHRGDGARFAKAFTNEEGQHQFGRMKAGLRGQPTHGCTGAQATGADARSWGHGQALVLLDERWWDEKQLMRAATSPSVVLDSATA